MFVLAVTGLSCCTRDLLLACGIFCCHTGSRDSRFHSGGTWGLVALGPVGSYFLTRDWIWVHCIGVDSAHWTTREVPKVNSIESIKALGYYQSFDWNIIVENTHKIYSCCTYVNNKSGLKRLDLQTNYFGKSDYRKKNYV